MPRKNILPLGQGGRLARLRRARRPSCPRLGAAAPRTPRKILLIWDLFSGGVRKCFRAHVGSIWYPFGVYLGADVLFIVLEILFIRRDRRTESHVSERTVEYGLVQ